MKTQKHVLTTLVVLALILTAALVACSPSATAESQSPAGLSEPQDTLASTAVASATIETAIVEAQGDTSVEPVAMQSDTSVTGELSEEEISGLLYMREEEKLAHDVYIALYEEWDLRIFQNIANSEQTHTDAVKRLLDAYGLVDPVVGMAPGEFVNSDLQALYNQLTVQGSQSLGDALKVGAAIEEIDILDLDERLAQTERADIQRVYENLLRGSSNHLRAFTSTLSRQIGESYQPQYMGAGAYQNIVSNASGFGGNGNGNRPQSRGRGRQWSQAS